MKPTILNYQEFIKTHRKYHREPSLNMVKHGYNRVIDYDLDIVDNQVQKSRDAVQSYIDCVGEDTYSQYVYYRTRDGWGLPYIFIFAKV